MKRCTALLCLICSLGSLTAQEVSSPEKSRPKVALVLAGGSAWGLAHIGVIKVLEEADIPVDIVVGTSMGSIIGGLYASGYSGTDLERIANTTRWSSFFREEGQSGQDSLETIRERSSRSFSAYFDRKGFFFGGGLISGSRIIRFLDTLFLGIPDTVSFDALPRRFRAVATDVSTAEAVVIESGPLTDALRASMSIPAVFTPVERNGQTLIDGGVVENLPIRVAKEMGADIIIAVDLYSGEFYDPADIRRVPASALTRTLEILLRTTVRQQLHLADAVIPVDIRGFLPTDFDRSAELAALGEKTARDHFDRLEPFSRRPSGQPETETSTYSAPVLERLEVTGADERDHFWVQRFYEEHQGRVPAPEDWDSLFARLDKTGRVSSIRLSYIRDTGGNFHRIRLAPHEAEKSSLSLGLRYEGTISAAMTGNIDIAPSVAIRDAAGKNSTLTVTMEILDAPGISVGLRKSFFPTLSFETSFSAQRDHITRITTTSIAWQEQTGILCGKLDAAWEPIPGFEFRGGISGISIGTEEGLETGDHDPEGYYSLLSARTEMNRLDSQIFPMDGFQLYGSFVYSSRSLGSRSDFRTLQTGGSTFVSLGTPFSVAVMWQAGTDFTATADDHASAPYPFNPDLENRRLFPGPLKMNEQRAHHVVGIGVEIKHHLNWKARGIHFPSFLVIQGGLGALADTIAATGPRAEILHANLAAGAGIRFSEAFALALRAGIHRGSSGTLTPFIAIDAGALASHKP